MDGQLASGNTERLKSILTQDLDECDAEHVFVVARRANEVMYWEDGEGGFNISPPDANGGIARHWRNQDSLATALNEWIDG